jgi:hypothetical protein
MAKRLKFKEGDWFTVPLRREQHALGLVARRDRHGDSFLGYYFAPANDGVPCQDYIAQLRPQDALLVGASGTYGFNHGTWKMICSSNNWDRNAWPIPVFVRTDSGNTKHLETYADEDVLLPIPAGDKQD